MAIRKPDKEKRPRVLLVPPPDLPVPAVQGGAVETLLTHLIRENEKQGLLELLCASVPDDAARRERVENLGIRKAAAFLHIQKNARQHAAGTARGRGDNDAACRVFFADGVGIGAHKAVFARFGAFIDVILTVEHFRFALHV